MPAGLFAVEDALAARLPLSVPENEHIRRAQKGDVASFEQLYRKHAGKIYALCIRLVNDKRTAEELTQDAFVRAWENLPGFRGESQLSTWLHRLTINVVLGSMRTRKRRSLRLLSSENPESHEQPEVSTDPHAAIDFENALPKLPEQSRIVFLLHEVEGYKHHEIGRMLGITSGTSKAQLHRARNKLKEALSL